MKLIPFTQTVIIMYIVNSADMVTVDVLLFSLLWYVFVCPVGVCFSLLAPIKGVPDSAAFATQGMLSLCMCVCAVHLFT